MKTADFLRQDELDYLSDSERCKCGHLQALHNFHCCEFCMVPGCGCENYKIDIGLKPE